MYIWTAGKAGKSIPYYGEYGISRVYCIEKCYKIVWNPEKNPRLFWIKSHNNNLPSISMILNSYLPSAWRSYAVLRTFGIKKVKKIHGKGLTWEGYGALDLYKSFQLLGRFWCFFKWTRCRACWNWNFANSINNYFVKYPL